MLIKGESPKDFAALYRQFLTLVQPRNVMELHAVMELTENQWRSRRMLNLGSQTLRQAMDAVPKTLPGQARIEVAYSAEAAGIGLLARYTAHYDMRFLSTLERLIKARQKSTGTNPGLTFPL